MNQPSLALKSFIPFAAAIWLARWIIPVSSTWIIFSRWILIQRTISSSALPVMVCDRRQEAGCASLLYAWTLSYPLTGHVDVWALCGALVRVKETLPMTLPWFATAMYETEFSWPASASLQLSAAAAGDFLYSLQLTDHLPAIDCSYPLFQLPLQYRPTLSARLAVWAVLDVTHRNNVRTYDHDYIRNCMDTP